MYGKRIKSKVFSVTLMMALILSSLVNYTYAQTVDMPDNVQPEVASRAPVANPKAGAVLPIMYVDYMESSVDGLVEKEIPKFAEDNVGKVFWVGVSIDNLKDLSVATAGMYSLELGFDYDPTYIEPYSDLTVEELTALGVTAGSKAAWLKSIEKYNFAIGIDTEDALKWNSGNYTLLSDACSMVTEFDTDSNREDTVDAGWKMTFISLARTTAPDVNSNRFVGTASVDKKCVISLPFILKKVPAVGEEIAPIKLSQGPQTLVIGAGASGYETFAAWGKTDVGEANNNLKNLVTFDGNLNLFGSVTDSVGALKVTSGADATLATYDLYKENTLTTVTAFDPDITDYYVRVPNSIEDVNISFDTDSADSVVKYKDWNPDSVETDVITSVVDKTVTTSAVPLGVVDATLNDGFNNTVTVTVGELVYRVHVQRLAEAKIELNPGNSPYGMIMRDGALSAEQKTAAKAAFDGSHAMNKHFADGFIPVDGDKTIMYTAKAWDSYKDGENKVINYDLNESAIFAYEGSKFKDPGIKVYGQDGNLVTGAVTKVTATLKVLPNNTLPDYTAAGTDLKLDFEGDANAKVYDVSGRVIRPDVYEMEYVYTYADAIDGSMKTVKVKRPLIVLSKKGDIQLSNTPTIGGADGNLLISKWRDIKNSLFAYRSADVKFDNTPTIGGADGNLLISTWRTPAKEYYIPLPVS